VEFDFEHKRMSKEEIRAHGGQPFSTQVLLINLRSSFLILKKAVMLNPTRQQHAAIASGKKKGDGLSQKRDPLEVIQC